MTGWLAGANLNPTAEGATKFPSLWLMGTVSMSWVMTWGAKGRPSKPGICGVAREGVESGRGGGEG